MVMPWFVFNLLSLPTAYIFSPSLILLCACGACADSLWMNVCSRGFIYLFRSTTSRPAEEEPSFYVNSRETRGRGAGRREREREDKKKNQEQKEDGGAARQRLLCRAWGHSDGKRGSFPHLELVGRNLMPALMSEPHSRKGRRREWWQRKYSPHLLHVKHKSVCDCAVAATWGTH